MKVCPVCHSCYGDESTHCVRGDHAQLVPVRPGTNLLLNQYRLERLVGRTLSQVVYAGTQVAPVRPVLVKLLSADAVGDAEARRRFRSETRTGAHFIHPNVAETYEYGTLPTGEPYVVMERVEGQTLRQFMAAVGVVPLGTAVLLGRQIADGIGAAHQYGLLNLRLTPATIVLARDDRHRLQAKITDSAPDHFKERGLTNLPLSSSEWAEDSGRYLSPEQAAARRVDERSDLYKLGLLLYEMAAGRPPFAVPIAEAVTSEDLKAVPPSVQDFRPEVPDALAQLILRLLHKNPSDRPRSAAEVALQLLRLDTIPTESTGEAPEDPGRSPRDRAPKPAGPASLPNLRGEPLRPTSPLTPGESVTRAVRAEASEARQTPTPILSMEATGGASPYEAPPKGSADSDVMAVGDSKRRGGDPLPARTGQAAKGAARIYEVPPVESHGPVPFSPPERQPRAHTGASPVAPATRRHEGVGSGVPYSAAPTGPLLQPEEILSLLAKRRRRRPMLLGVGLVLALAGLAVWFWRSQGPFSFHGATARTPARPPSGPGSAVLPSPITRGEVRVSPEIPRGTAPRASPTPDAVKPPTPGVQGGVLGEAGKKAVAEPSPITPRNPEAALRAALDEWVVSTKERSLERQGRLYLRTVAVYYDRRNVSRADVLADKSRIFRQTKVIDIQVSEPKIVVTPEGRSATMRFRKRYLLEGDRQRRRGEVMQELRWLKTGGGWKIDSEQDIEVLR